MINTINTNYNNFQLNYLFRNYAPDSSTTLVSESSSFSSELREVLRKSETDIGVKILKLEIKVFIYKRC